MYLNDGRGDAWAGHDSDNANPEGCWYVADLSLLENLGALPPTVSKYRNSRLLRKIILLFGF